MRKLSHSCHPSHYQLSVWPLFRKFPPFLKLKIKHINQEKPGSFYHWKYGHSWKYVQHCFWKSASKLDFSKKTFVCSFLMVGMRYLIDLNTIFVYSWRIPQLIFREHIRIRFHSNENFEKFQKIEMLSLPLKRAFSDSIFFFKLEF